MWGMLRVLQFLLLIILLLSTEACHPIQASGTQQANIPRQQNPLNIRHIDSCITLLRSGQIALRTGADPISFMLRQMNEKDKKFSHCGIVIVEDGYPFVYHSVGGEDNPDAQLQRDSAKHFFNATTNERIGIASLDLSTENVAHLAEVVNQYYKAKVLFDMDFNLADSSRFYCSEFVYHAVRNALSDTSYFKTSVLQERNFVGIDDLFAAPHGGIICDVPFK